MPWKQDILDHVTQYVGRGRSPVYSQESEYPVINQACIQWEGLALNKVKFVSKEFFERLDQSRRTQRGDIFVNSTGVGTLGRIGYWRYDESVAYDSHVTVVRTKPDFNSQFLFYWLQMPEAQKQIENECITGSTNQTELSREAFRRIRVYYPVDKSEQSTIAHILVTLDRAIETSEALIAKLRRIKTGLMQSLLTRGIDEHGNLRDPATHRFKDSPLGRVPVEWEVKSLAAVTKKIADRDHTTPYYVDRGVPIVSPTNLTEEGEIDFSGCRYITHEAHILNRRRTDIRVGDVVIHRIGAGLGGVFIVTDQMPDFSILHSMALIRPNNKVMDSLYCLWCLRSNAVQRQISLGIQSIGVPDLGLDKLGQLKVALPGLQEQITIQQVLETHQQSIRVELEKLTKLRRLKTGLMQDLLTGRVSVAPLLNEENTDD